MNIFGIGIGELLVVLLLGVVVIGPERLPQLVRSFGRMVAHITAWQQTSPEARMFHEMRQEFNREIQDIRDELTNTRQQIVNNIDTLPQESRELLSNIQRHMAIDTTRHASEQTRPTESGGASETSVQSATVPTARPTRRVVPAAPTSTSTPNPTPTNTPHHTHETNGTARTPETLPATHIDDIEPNVRALAEEIVALMPIDTDAIDTRLHAVMADMHALIEHLREKGYVTSDWKPPSHSM